MKMIKRLDVSGLTEKLGLTPAAIPFIFKPAAWMPHDEFEPHRSEMYSLALILKGEATLMVGLDTLQVQGPGLVMIPPDDIRQWKTADAALSIIGVFFTEEFVAGGIPDTHVPYYRLDDETFTTLKTIFDLIAIKAESHQIESLQALTHVALLELKQLHQVPVTDSFSQGYLLTEKFKALVARDYLAHRAVKYYADQLFISPKHLSQSVKEQIGKTAGELIDERVGLEAKILLQNAALNIAEVAEALNFVSATFFGKFFKRIYGMSPLEYRKRVIRHLEH